MEKLWDKIETNLLRLLINISEGFFSTDINIVKRKEKVNLSGNKVNYCPFKWKVKSVF